MLRFLLHLFGLIISPGRGWEDIAHAGENPDNICKSGLYPFYAVAALSSFFPLIYDKSDVTFTFAIQQAIIVFAVYFVLVFIIPIILYPTLISGSMIKGAPNRKRITSFTIYCLALMSLTLIISNLIPYHFDIIDILPAYLILVIAKSEKYLGVDKKKNMSFLILSSFIIIGAPLLFIYLLNLILL